MNSGCFYFPMAVFIVSLSYSFIVSLFHSFILWGLLFIPYVVDESHGQVSAEYGDASHDVVGIAPFVEA